MIDLFEQRIVGTGRLPLFGFFVAFIVTFVLTRVNVRLIRKNVRWWFRNVQAGDVHIHHVVFGVVLMLVGGVASLAIPDERVWFHLAAAVVFGMGSALVLDEFALILHLSDVYWTEKGRASVDAVFVAIAVTGLLVLGVNPLGFEAIPDVPGLHVASIPGFYVASLAVNLVLAVATLLKGKIWTGLIGLFVPALLIVGAVRVARPGSPWSRWRYDADSGRYQRAVRREKGLRRPLISGKIWVQEFIAGRHDLLPPELSPRTTAERARRRKLARAQRRAAARAQRRAAGRNRRHAASRVRARATARLAARRARADTTRTKNPRLRLGYIRTARAQAAARPSAETTPPDRPDAAAAEGAAGRDAEPVRRARTVDRTSGRRGKPGRGRTGRVKVGRGKIGRVRAERAAGDAGNRTADENTEADRGG